MYTIRNCYTYIQLHWQFLITYSCFWLVNILLRKCDTSTKKEMQMIKTKIFWWKTKKKKKIAKKVYVCMYKHGTIIRTGITYKKIPRYMRDSAYRWFLVENAKIFSSYVKHFWIFPRERNCRILIGLCKEVFMNHPIMFLDRDNKGKLVPPSFSYFLMGEK